MPTIWDEDGFRFYFYSNEGQEPPHIHVAKAERRAKAWLETCEIIANANFNANEQRAIRRILRRKQDDFIAAWAAYFGKKG